MSNKVFVGGLNWGTKEEGLQDFFREVGEISSVKIITDRETGRSRGFGFVEFTSEESANAAVNSMNGAELDGRVLKVSIAMERNQRSGGYDNRDRGGYGNRNHDRGGNRW